MKRIFLALGLAIAGTALADKTVTWLAADAKIESVSLTISGQQVFAYICGSVLGSDGVTVRTSCTRTELTGASKTAVLNWVNGAGLTAWKNADGI